MRVSMSAMVSLFIASPRALAHAGDLPDAGVLPEADAAEAELAHVRPRTSAVAAPVVLLRGEPRRPQRLGDQRFLCHLNSSGRASRALSAATGPQGRWSPW